MTEQIDWGKATNHHEWLASRKIPSVEELGNVTAGTRPKTSHHRSPGVEDRGVERRSARWSS